MVSSLGYGTTGLSLGQRVFGITVEIVDRVRDGRFRTHIGTVATLDDAVLALNPTHRRKGKTVIRVRP